MRIAKRLENTHAEKMSRSAGDREPAPRQLTSGAALSQAPTEGGTLRRDMAAFVCHNPLPAQLIKRYVGYAKEFCHPVLTRDAKVLLKEFYLELRKQAAMSPSTPVTVRIIMLPLPHVFIHFPR